MKAKPCFVAVVFLCMLAAGCAGTGPLKETPHHLADGNRQAAQGQAWYAKGCYQRALEHFFRAHELHASVDQIDGAAMALNSIGSVHRVLGDNSSAQKFFAEAAVLYEDAGDRKGARQALTNMAATLISRNLLVEAEKTLNQAQAIKIPNETRRFVPIMNNRGVLLSKQGEFDKAEEVLKQALAATPSSDIGGAANVNFSLGMLMLEIKRFEDAANYFNKALAADRLVGFYKGIGDDLANMGKAYMNLGDAAKAANAWKRAALVYALLEMPEKVQDTTEQLRIAAGECGMDLFVTDFFTNRWLKGLQYESPCKR